MRYLVRVSELVYGVVEVDAENEEAAKKKAARMDIPSVEREITDMTVEPLGGR